MTKTGKENGNGSKVFGLRKFTLTLGYCVVAMAMVYSALLLGKVSGSEFLQGLLYTGGVVSAYSGLNVLKEKLRK